MTRRERVFAAPERRPVDRPPVSSWRHAPELDHDHASWRTAVDAVKRPRC